MKAKWDQTVEFKNGFRFVVVFGFWFRRVAPRSPRSSTAKLKLNLGPTYIQKP